MPSSTRRLLLPALLLAAALPSTAHAASCAEPDSWVAGSTALCEGAIVYSDYVHDDYGADTGSSNTTSRTAGLAPTAGDESYPGGKDATADIVRLTLRIDGDRLRVTALMNALFAPDSTVLAVAIDSDGTPLTGGGKWGQLDVSSRGWDRIAFFDRGDPATNTISGSMPLPPGTRWRVQAAAAIKGTGHVMNVAFRGVDEQARAKGAPTSSDEGSWFEDQQAAAIGAGDISRFGYDVGVADLRAGATRTPPPVTGFHERVYTSRYTVPPQNEGVDVDGVPGRGNGGGAGQPIGFEQTFQYLGRFQPYGVYIPKRPGPHGMQMVFHGSSSVFTGLINQPGMQQQFGEQRNRVLVVPEARGQNGFGSDISERDLLDVMADVEASYPIDRDRVFSGGYSQGGYITYRMAELYPDRFAGAVDWVGFTGDDENGTPLQGQGYTAGAVGNAIDLVGNLRHVPAFLLYAGADELVHVNTAVAMDRAFQATDDIFTFYLHPAAEHLTFAALDEWSKESADTADLRLVKNPPRVTYRTARVLDDPAHGIAHDRAYWVSDLRGRAKDDKAFEDVDLTTFACGGSVPVTETGNGGGPGPVPWTSDFRRRTATKALPRRAALEGTLRNVASLTVDSTATCLAAGALSYKLTTDGPATLRLSDGRTLAITGAGTHAGTLAAPTLSASRSCVSRRAIRLHVRRPRGARVRSITLLVNGRRAKRVRGNRARTTVSLRGLPKGTVRVRAVVHAVRRGKRIVVRDTRTYRTCARRQSSKTAAPRT
jgi:dienelactone hydrolase